MLMLGQFSDDISMYATKNQKFNLMTLIANILSPDNFTQKMPLKLKTLLTGRMFASCTVISDLMNVHE